MHMYVGVDVCMCVVLGLEPRLLYILEKFSTIELYLLILLSILRIGPPVNCPIRL